MTSSVFQRLESANEYNGFHLSDRAEATGASQPRANNRSEEGAEDGSVYLTASWIIARHLGVRVQRRDFVRQSAVPLTFPQDPLPTMYVPPVHIPFLLHFRNLAYWRQAISVAVWSHLCLVYGDKRSVIMFLRHQSPRGVFIGNLLVCPVC